jgi:hypothetical protein
MMVIKYKVKLVFLPMLIVIFPCSVFAEDVSAAQAVKPIDKKILPVTAPANPPVITPAAQQQAGSQVSPSATPMTPLVSDPMKTKSLANSGMSTMPPKMAVKLEDPTRISDSFQSALKRLGPQTADATGTTTPAAVTVLPDIELAAIIDGYGKERTALIKLGKKTHMVREGYTFTEIKGNVVLEIYVEKIELCEIKLNVSPPNQLLILR